LENPRPRVRWTVFAVIALLAFGVRLPQLGERPMHTDEAVNAYITGELLEGETFRYDPQDRHGPALYLFAKPVVELCGARKFADLTEVQVRLTPVIISSITVLLFGAGVEMFGFGTCMIAAMLFAFAPLPFYYGRYFIHETLFVAATLGLILSAGRVLKAHSFVAAALAGLCAALMLAAKETAVIHFFALAVAAVCGWAWKARVNRNQSCTITPGTLALAVAVFVVTTIFMFTWGGRNWEALTDLIRALPRFAKRAGGEGHEKPFWYYLVLLGGGWSGAILVTLAVGGFIVTLNDFSRDRAFSPLSFISVYGIIVSAAYSFIPYKTPWLALNFWLPMSLLIGLFLARAWKKFEQSPGHWLLAAPAVLIAIAIRHDVRNRVFRFPADEKNPYAYAHTVDGLLDLPPRLEALAKEQHLASPRIAVIAADPWPLPWYLRRVSQVGFWKPGVDTGPANFYITSPEAAEKLAERLHGFRPEYFGLRPEAILILWRPDQAATNPPTALHP
jgi:uncharacterized protein (TIGR03663 family)